MKKRHQARILEKIFLLGFLIIIIGCSKDTNNAEIQQKVPDMKENSISHENGIFQQNALQKDYLFHAVGSCPKCGNQVEGSLVFWDGHDEKGNLISGTEYRGECESCGAILRAKGYSDIKTMRVEWKVIQSNFY